MSKAQQTPEQARAALADLEARLDAGDEAVTAEQLVAARTAVEIAERHQQARQRIEAARAERERQERIGALLDSLGDWVAIATVEDAATAIVAAMAAYLEVAEPFVRQRAEAMEELYRLASGPGRNPCPDRLDIVNAGRMHIDGYTVEARSALQELRAVVVAEVDRRETERAQAHREREFAERQRRQRAAAVHLVEPPESLEQSA